MKRSDAFSLGLTTYVPDVPCRRGHSLRYVSNGACVACVDLGAQKYRDLRTQQEDLRGAYQLKARARKHKMAELHAFAAGLALLRGVTDIGPIHARKPMHDTVLLTLWVHPEDHDILRAEADRLFLSHNVISPEAAFIRTDSPRMKPGTSEELAARDIAIDSRVNNG